MVMDAGLGKLTGRYIYVSDSSSSLFRQQNFTLVGLSSNRSLCLLFADTTCYT